MSNALHIIGMFMPKLGFTPFFAAGVLAAGLAAAAGAATLVLLGAVSAARSHDPISWERATEKNRST
ncbi:hypothetical protein ACPOLB_14265 [Rubrivivax sp. RP6-9]|uniref:hypothetical protein n=1 Tax=Rubrivivax sp. RP6-9 TaxID=3415750 RepID=UPI003CC5AE49